ncbi:MAG: extracellular solute-binding protein [Clostridia bacterium]|nr:extracellular solute-binding protein [Clostridia bacterium]
MKSKKLGRILSLALSLITVLSSLSLTAFAHGSKKRAEFKVPDTFDTSKHYEITFWSKNDNNITQKKIYEKAIEEFEAIYPNIKVTLRSFTDYNAIYNDVITNIPTNTTPNVCISYPDHIATYLTGSNVVVPLDDLIADEKFGLGGSELKFDGAGKDGIIEKFLNEGKLSGVQYALPFMRSSEALYINRDLVKKLGYEIPDILTWDFVFELSSKAIAMGTDENGLYRLNGQKTLLPFIYKSTDNMMIQMTAQRGTGYATDYGKILLFNDSTREILKDVAKYSAEKSFHTFAIVSYPGNYFNAGQCIFAIDSTAGATWMGPDAPLQEIPEDQRLAFETVVRPIPQFDTENPKMISQGPSICVFNKEDPGEVLASWLFAQYLLTDSTQMAYSQTEGYVPVTKSGQTNPAYLEYLSKAGADNELYYKVKIDAAKLVIDYVDSTFITEVFVGSASLRSAAGELIEGTVRQIRRGKEVNDEFIDQLYKDTIKLKRLNIDGDASGTRANLGPLPGAAVALLCSIAAVWVIIGLYFLAGFLRKRKNAR